MPIFKKKIIRIDISVSWSGRPIESAKVMVTLPVLTRFEFLFVIDSSFCFLLGLSVSRMLGEKANCKQFTKKFLIGTFFIKKSGSL